MADRSESAASTPWFVVGPPWNEGAPWINAGSEDPHGGEFVCDLAWPHDADTPENVARTEANAALIVQAANERPQLLAALEELLDVAERRRAGDPSLNPEAWYAARDFARIVLKEAKAERAATIPIESDACPACGTPGGRYVTHVCMTAGIPSHVPECGASDGKHFCGLPKNHAGAHIAFLPGATVAWGQPMHFYGERP